MSFSKMECVYKLLSMLGSYDSLEKSKKFLELSSMPESCVELRRTSCIPLLAKMVYCEEDEHVRQYANIALHNVVHSHADDKLAAYREIKVLHLLDQIAGYCNLLETQLQRGDKCTIDDSVHPPLAAALALMQASFDEEHRQVMVELGALYAIPNLVQLEYAMHGSKPNDQRSNSLRRHALMALTNLTFGDENNKDVLCTQKYFMETLIAQLDNAPDDVLQPTTSVLRNLSWRASTHRKAVLNEIGTVTALTRAALKNKKENTLKFILSALWNVTAHSSENKAEFCAVEGALPFLVETLTFEGSRETSKIIESAGGILHNVSSHIAVQEHYRQMLRERNCMAILLQQLKSESLTVVRNACNTLLNLSARCAEDQKFLWDNGAVPVLQSLMQSKQATISESCAAILTNLIQYEQSLQNTKLIDNMTHAMEMNQRTTWNIDKQKASVQDSEQQQQILTERHDNPDATIATAAMMKHINLSGNKAAREDDDSHVGNEDATWNNKERRIKTKLNTNKEAHTSKRILFQNCNARLAQSVEHETLNLRVWEFPTLGNWKKRKKRLR